MYILFTMLTVIEKDGSDFSSDCEFDYRQFYERSSSSENLVTMTAEEKKSSDRSFVLRKVKVINIGPDPPLCNKRYIWGRKSKFMDFSLNGN